MIDAILVSAFPVAFMALYMWVLHDMFRQERNR